MLPIGQHFVFGAIFVELTSLLRLMYGRAQDGFLCWLWLQPS